MQEFTQTQHSYLMVFAIGRKPLIHSENTTALLNLVQIPQKYTDVSELLNDTVIRKRKQNGKMFILLLENIQYLGRQGQAFQVNEEEESNYNQLISPSR